MGIIKLRTYSLYKNEILTEPYVSCRVSKYKRSLFCQLRIGILPLEIETGRHYRLKLEDRICKICEEAIEDEIHFLCMCPGLKNIRTAYYKIFHINNCNNYIDQF